MIETRAFDPSRCGHVGWAARLLRPVLLGALLAGTAAAQTEDAGHLGHHPGGAESSAESAPPVAPSTTSPAAAVARPPAMPGGTGGGCMGCMGSGARPFYAAMLDMPLLTPEARLFIEAEAGRRIAEGTQAVTAAQTQMHHALAVNDALALGHATSSLREGVLLLESGTAARRVVAAEASPREFALNWFRDQLAVPAVEAAPMVMGDGPWGLSWYHVTTMAALVAFLIATLLIQRARTRRIDGLVERLAPAAAGATKGAGSPPGATPKADARKAPQAAEATAPAASTGAANPAAAPPGDAKQRPWSGMLRVAAIFVETPDVKTFRLEDPNDGAIPFTFLPGQFLTFAGQINGKPIRRSYTIASSPAQRDYVEITVKREKLGAESRYLHDQVAVGDPLQVSGPAGAFTFTGNEADSIVLIGGGVGITPMMCAIRYLTDRGYPGDIFFLYGAATSRDFIFREELEYLRKRHPNLHIAATMVHAEGTDWTGAVGFITDAFIANAVPDIARRRVHLCGPPAMMEAVKATLIALGVARDKIKTEAFGPAQGRALPPGPDPAAAPPAAVAPPGPEAAAAPREPAAAAPPTATTQVEFSKSGKTGPLAPDQTVLEAAEAIGVAIDYSCRVGTCGTCVVPLQSGAVTMEVEEGLPPEEKARGIILACQAKSIGNLVIEA